MISTMNTRAEATLGTESRESGDGSTGVGATQRRRWGQAAARLCGLRRLTAVLLGLLAALMLTAPTFAEAGGSGPYQTDIQIEVPSYHGLEPNLQLVYNPSGSNDWLGVGWELSVPSYISRVSAGRGAPDYDGGDIYLLDGQELMKCVVGMQSPSCQYRVDQLPGQPIYQAYTTKVEGFQRIAYSSTAGGRWYVWSTAGVKSAYAPDLTTSGGIYRWHLESVEDAVGNKVNYTYGYLGDEPGAPYLDVITYNSVAVKFYWEERTDRIVAATGRSLMTIRYRLKTIDVSVGGARARAYALGYATRASSSERSLLTTVRHYGADAVVDGMGNITSGSQLPLISLGWSNNGAVGSWGQGPAVSAGWSGMPVSSPSGFDTPFTTSIYLNSTSSMNEQTMAGDLDGDDRSDWIRARYDPASGKIMIASALAEPNGTFTTIHQEVFIPLNQRLDRIWPSDLNGDGKDDLLFTFLPYQTVTSGYSYQMQLQAALSKGDGTFAMPVATPQPTNWYKFTSNAGVVTPIYCQIGDPNGSGKTAFVCSFQRNGQSYVGTAVLKGDNTFMLYEVQAPTAGPLAIQMGDLNADGYTDLILFNAYLGTLTPALSQGTGNYVFKPAQTPTPSAWTGDGELYPIDLNGDGRTDFIRLRLSVEFYPVFDTIQTAITQPDGTFVFTDRPIPSPLNPEEFRMLLGDANGDGYTDLLVAVSYGVTWPCTSTRAQSLIIRVTSNGDGTFDFPSNWADCQRAQPVNLIWPVDTDIARYARRAPDFTAPDANGDGLVDFQGLQRTFSGYAQIVTGRSQRTKIGAQHWIAADIDGDGRSDSVAIVAKSTGVRIITLKRTNAGIVSAEQDRLNDVVSPIAGSWKVGDVNRDGRADLIYILNYNNSATDRGLRVYTLLSRGDGAWDELSQNTWPNYGDASPGAGGRDTPNWKATDSNGDGKTDLVRLYFAPDVPQSLRVDTMLANGDGSWSDVPQSVTLDTPIGGDVVSDALNWRVADINGDGKADLFNIVYTNPGIRIRSLLSTGTGSWNSRTNDAWAGFSASNTRNWRVADVNADGKADLIHLYMMPDQTTLRVHSLLGRGDAVWEARWYDALTDPQGDAAFGDFAYWIAADLNKDGRSDLLHLATNGSKVLMSTGNGLWSAKSSPITLQQATLRHWRPADANGDGVPDLVRVDQQPSTIVAWMLNANPMRDLLAEIWNPAGVTTKLQYQSSSAWAVNNPAEGCWLPVGSVLDTIASVIIRDNRTGVDDIETHTYGCARWSVQERRFLGWQNMSATRGALAGRPESKLVERYRLQDVGAVELLNSSVQDASGNVIAQTELVYQPADTALPYRSLVQTRQVSQCNQTSTCLQKEIDYAYDAFGNATTTIEYLGPRLNGRARETRRLYNVAAGPYLAGLVSSEAVFDRNGGNAVELHRTLFCYDGDNAGCNQPPSRGLLTATKKWNNQTNSYQITTAEYDAFGNVIKEVDANNQATPARAKTVEYDPTYHLFATRTCNALNQCTAQEWNYVFGQQTKRTDPNNLVTTWSYDPFGRLSRTISPSGLRVDTQYNDFGDVANQRITEISYPSSGPPMTTDRYIDGMNRTWKKVQGFGAKSIVQIVEYIGASSMVARQSHWFYDPTEQPVYESFQYDAAGRTIRQTHPDNTTLQWSYGNDAQRQWVASTDERSHTRKQYSDSFGRIVTVREVNQGAATDTTYAYDMLDRVTSVTDSAGNTVTVITWDSLGRKLQQQDTDLGTWTYTYDNVGNILRQTDARGTVMTFAYDALNRPISKNNGATTTWRYDEGGHGPGIGRLTSIVDPTGTGCPAGVAEDLRYDSVGNLSSDSKCVTGKSYTMGFGYDNLGRMASATYPDGEVVSYGYDQAGRLVSATNNRGETYVREMTYTAAGQLRAATYGNGTVATYDYDPQRERLSSAALTAGSAKLYQAQYSYLPNGLIQSSASSTNQMNLTYTYDDLDRLTAVSGDMAQTFRYDALGNMTYNSSIGNYSYPAYGPNGCGSGVPCARTHAVQQAGTRTYAYDANGNMTGTIDSANKNAARTIVWNADNLPSEVQIGHKVQLAAQYDAGGERVVAQRGTAISRFYGRWLEDSAAGLTRYYYAGGRLIARRDGGGVFWYHQDHLGSTRLLTNQIGQVVQRYDYTPFGETRGGTGMATTDIRYTGQRSEDAVNLIYMHARYYDPQIGRFTAADSIIPRPYDPQSLNRYSYVTNNPISYIDPTGHANMPSAWIQSIDISFQWAVETGNLPASGTYMNVHGGPIERRVGYQITTQTVLIPEGEEITLVATPIIAFTTSSTVSDQGPVKGKEPLSIEELDLLFRARAQAVLKAEKDIKIMASNPLAFMPMFLPGQGPGTFELGPGLVIDIALTADDLNDWVGPFADMAETMERAPAQIRQYLQAEQERRQQEKQFRQLTQALNSAGLYWAWQEPPLGSGGK